MALFHTRPPTTSTTKDAFSHCETCPAAARKTPNGVSVSHVSKLERCLTASGNLTWDVSKGQKRLFRALFRAKIQHNFSTKYPYSTRWSYGCLPCHKKGAVAAPSLWTRRIPHEYLHWEWWREGLEYGKTVPYIIIWMLCFWSKLKEMESMHDEELIFTILT